jgi:hypothetical protein
MAFKMRGNPFQRNFGIGKSPVKQGVEPHPREEQRTREDIIEDYRAGRDEARQMKKDAKAYKKDIKRQAKDEIREQRREMKRDKRQDREDRREGSPYQRHTRNHMEDAHGSSEIMERTRLDDDLEKDDKRGDRWNPDKQVKLEDKASRKREKADEALEKTETEGKGHGKAYRTEKRAQDAEKKARLEAGKRGRDSNSSENKGKGIKSIKGSGRKGIFGQDKKALSR